jgi:AraC family transcriptional regulator
MHAKLEQPFTLRSMAETAFASQFHFNRTFRRITGIPPTQFLYALRIARARRLLCSTQMHVTEICYEVGYNSLGTFTRRFTELVGVSPTCLRSMSRSYDWPAMRPLYEALHSTHPASSPGVAGFVAAPPEFRGPILVGLFQQAIPQRAPLAYTMLWNGGPFQLTQIPDGAYYIAAIAPPVPSDPAVMFEPVWRARARRIIISNQQTRDSTDLRLRLSTVFDPPILTALPLLLTRFQRRSGNDAVCSSRPID